MKKIFIPLSIILLNATSANADKNWSAELALENSVNWQKTDNSRVGIHLLTFNPALSIGEQKALGIELETESSSSFGQKENSSQTENSYRMNETKIYAQFGAYDFGDFSLFARPLALLPTNKAERNAGMQFAAGAEAELRYSVASKISLAWSSQATRYLRHSERANSIGENEQFLADGFAKYRFENELLAKWNFLKNTFLNLGAKHTHTNQWFGKSEDLLEWQQLLSYESGIYAIEIGHSSENILRNASGETKSVALFRANESKLVLNLMLSI